MNILLTGSNGFIGSNLKNYLTEKYNLLTPVRYELDLTNSNKVFEYFNNNNIDFIIHCASIGGVRGVEDKNNTKENNLLMVNNLIKFKNINARIILFGSGAMYDKQRNLKKVKEDEIGKYYPGDLYGQSKVEIAELVKKRDDITCLNIFACYGYNEKLTRFPSYAINCVLKNEPIKINQNAVFDYLFIEDLEKIVNYFIKNNPNDKIINVTPDESISLYEMAKIINSFKGNKNKIEIINPEMNFEYTGNNSLLKKNYPKVSFISHIEGLKKLYCYMEKTAFTK